MPFAGRSGDKAQASIDAHGCPACPHSAVGPAQSGSNDVLINGRAALRVGDHGIHSNCCGANIWMACVGAQSVYINSRPAHRVNDQTQHCGGVGMLIEGSADVLIGEEGAAPAQPADLGKKSGPSEDQIIFAIRSQLTGKAIAGLTVTIRSPSGKELIYRTDVNGDIILNDAVPGVYAVIRSDGTEYTLSYKSTEVLETK